MEIAGRECRYRERENYKPGSDPLERKSSTGPLIPDSFICSAGGILKPASQNILSKPCKQPLRQTAAQDRPQPLLTNKSLNMILRVLHSGRGPPEV